MIGAIENAIVGVLRDAGEAGELGYRYRWLDTYPDDFDTYLSAKKGQIRTPAAWVVFLSLSECTDPSDGSGVQGEARFALVVAAQNLRNETASRHGGPDSDAEPGSYQLAVDAARLLSRNWLEPLALIHPIELSQMRLLPRTAAMAANNLSLMAIELTCIAPLGEFASDDAPFDRLHIDWDVPPIGNVTPPLPAAQADARDDIELPQ